MLEAAADGTGQAPARFGAAAETVHLPAPAVRLLKEILRQMASGNGVALTPLHAELTTRQAAGLLQVSRTHLVQLRSTGDRYPVPDAGRPESIWCAPIGRVSPIVGNHEVRRR